MALSNKKIREMMSAGDVVISPFKEENLSTSSYDVTLGEYYFEERDELAGERLYNPYSKADVDRVWGTEPLTAKTAEEVLKGRSLPGIAPSEQVILIAPGRTILAHTQEYIGGRNHITTMMKARSSLGRNFIEVCKCAGWGDVGYTNRWTMEITNNSRCYTIPLVVGRRIAQIVFFETGEVDGAAGQYEAKGKYQGTADLAELEKSWDPSMMLPKMYKDREVR